MADEQAAEGKTVPTNTPDYGCISDLDKQQADTAGPPPKPAGKPATQPNTEE